MTAVNTKDALNAAAKWALGLVQLVLVIFVGVAVNDLSSIKADVAVLDANVERLTDLHQQFHAHVIKDGIHDPHNVKRAMIYEIVKKEIEASLELVMVEMRELRREMSELPPDPFMDGYDEFKREMRAQLSEIKSMIGKHTEDHE